MKNKSKHTSLWIILLVVLTGCNQAPHEPGGTKPLTDSEYQMISRDIFSRLVPVKGELVYVPVYSEIYGTDIDRKIKLSATLSIRNIDMEQPIIVSRADYYDTHGNLIRQYLDNPLELRPLQTKSYVVEYKEAQGGTGANFIVEWTSQQQVSEPVIEAVMIGTSSALGISFVCQGKVIKYLNP
ncbi:MAG: DUF3124 domain-containing protein [Bacteroidales bacterium]|jgi:hypothetical protein|nr:DUF3124 domain-containing protein [Bacteroidales bacterium]NCU35762.1 DUF3124 domain-containing protein [Candidatus Falkowbacteria bacterium]MDD2633348.1 DUF3124 domain-containing protein [Bacteroidales bacterium]MDD4177485.1 DUF3124 domain-containing protein [Bacteroidales bacterium]MDD4742357.1 DUF3124 domain-containing protein [Bacteroidales bacterium]